MYHYYAYGPKNKKGYFDSLKRLRESRIPSLMVPSGTLRVRKAERRTHVVVEDKNQCFEGEKPLHQITMKMAKSTKLKTILRRRGSPYDGRWARSSRK